MSKFNVGDKVTRKVPNNSSVFYWVLPHREYYIVTKVQNAGHGLQWLQVDGYGQHLEDPYPWCGYNFELYVEPEEELPPAPESVRYYHQGYRGIQADTYLDVSHGHYATGPRIRINDKDNRGITIDADAALQLAHDLLRMAMDIKRRGKAQ